VACLGTGSRFRAQENLLGGSRAGVTILTRIFGNISHSPNHGQLKLNTNELSVTAINDLQLPLMTFTGVTALAGTVFTTSSSVENGWTVLD
jgi:hypothetical protein